MFFYLKALKNYATFAGRAYRTEYWMFVLFNALAGIFLSLLATTSRVFDILEVIYLAALFIPGLAVAIRRLHDTSRSGWCILLAFLPLIGWIILFVFLVKDSTPGDNMYGPNPKEKTERSTLPPSHTPTN